jgi:hypothetical protein
MARTRFHACRNGFAFRPCLARETLTLPGGRRIELRGRQGGMAYAALDYFEAGCPLPASPAESPWLVDYLHLRLRQSFATPSAVRFPLWAMAEDGALARAVAGYEVPRLCRSLDAGYPAVIGLIRARSLDELSAGCRQAVAYGYETCAGGAVRFALYDDEEPLTEVTLTVSAAATSIQAANRPYPWRGFFLHDYRYRKPPTGPAPADAEASPARHAGQVRAFRAVA